MGLERCDTCGIFVDLDVEDMDEHVFDHREEEMMASCGFCGRTIVARSEGELCPHCVESFARRLQRPRPMFEDPASLVIAVALVFVSGFCGYLFQL